jgi:hypothetical protein
MIPNDIKEVLVGILLGDAHIVKRSSTSNSRLVYAQTVVKHKEYFEYVYKKFTPQPFGQVLKTIYHKLELLERIELMKNIVLYLLQLCNFLVLMYLEKCFICQT